LREAERLYQAGRYQDSARAADDYLRFFPDDFQALVIAGISAYNNGDYLSAKKHITKAHAREPKHPLVLEYTALLREIEYRGGSLSSIPLQPPASNDYETASYFKRGYFGPGFAHPSGTAIETVLARSEVAMPMPHPETESIFKTQPVLDIAEKAFDEGNFHKSYLFYSQLLAAQPTNRRFLIGRAESAFHMKRYRQVVDMLGPLLAAPETQGFNDPEIKKARQLLSDARQKAFSEQP
jgi:tetratricopeptide (TPR) repeat protein